MSNLIVILEGADGTGKSTLANVLAEATKGSVIHAYYDKDWDMEEYHTALFAGAMMLSHYKPVILDRWAPSEYVYGKVFRKGPSYDVLKLIDEASESAHANGVKLVWVYCRNDNVEQNHQKNKETRAEMFDSNMDLVQAGFDDFVKAKDLGWITYDFNVNGSKEELAKFIDKLLQEASK